MGWWWGALSRGKEDGSSRRSGDRLGVGWWIGVLWNRSVCVGQRVR